MQKPIKLMRELYDKHLLERGAYIKGIMLIKDSRFCDIFCILPEEDRAPFVIEELNARVNK